MTAEWTNIANHPSVLHKDNDFYAAVYIAISLTELKLKAKNQ